MEGAEKDIKDHWNRVYEKKKADTLGWYEEHPAPCLNLILECNLQKSARILSVGVGASKLIDNLIGLGYHNLIASDISLSAMNVSKDRYSKEMLMEKMGTFKLLEAFDNTYTMPSGNTREYAYTLFGK